MAANTGDEATPAEQNFVNGSFIAVLFVDVYDSVGLFERLGDERAHRLIAQCRSNLIDIIERGQGRVVKTQGDSILAVFATADLACDAAIEMQRMACEPPVLLKTAFQFGPVIEENGDVFGNTVNMAARMVSMARPQEILTAEETVSVLTAHRPALSRFLVAARMKGKSAPTRIYVVHPDQDTQLTVQAVDLSAERRARHPNCLLLVIGRDRERVLTSADRRIMIGRDTMSDIFVQEQVVSRRHAVIEAKGGDFFLTDCSTNGTFVQGQGGDIIQLRRECIALSGAGLIALGRWPRPQQPHVIRFARLRDEPDTTSSSVRPPGARRVGTDGQT